MALNLSRNTKVFVSSVNGVHASGGSVKTLDLISGVNASHAVGDVITFGTTSQSGAGLKAIVAAVSSGKVTELYLPNNFRGSGFVDNETATSTASTGSGTNGLIVTVNGVTGTTTTDNSRTALGLFKGNGDGTGASAVVNTFRIGVLDGYSFSQGSEATDVTINEAGATPNRGSKRFNDSLPPAEWSFGTYVRPFKHGTNSWRDSGDMDMVENILWASIAGASITDTDPSGTTSDPAVIIDGTSADVDFARSEHHELLKLSIFFALENTTYRLNDAQVNQCEIDFSIDGIAQLTWSGNATTIDQVSTVIEDPSKALHVQKGNTTANHNTANVLNGTDNSVTTATFVEGYNFADPTGPDDADYLRNKLSTLTLVAAAQGGGSASGGLDARTYAINITGGSISIANNVTYVTPETLGIIDKPIGSFTGARQITGNLTCYLDTKDDGSNQLLTDLASATNLVSNVFDMSLFMGGASSAVPVVEFSIPRAHMQVPTIETGDLISTSVEFSAHGTTLTDADEMTIVYKGLTTHSDSRYSADLTVE
mgnify:CR=1 FL=1